MIAICGKGGVGKTAVSALVSRALIEAGRRPLLLIDADPVGGLTAAIGERAVKTLGMVREQIIAAARHGDERHKARLADELDYLVLEALLERDDYALLAMGRKTEKGCFCPVNTLLRDAIDTLVQPFAAVLIDAEAGIEQINRQVTRRVSQAVVVTDGSSRSRHTLDLIAAMVGPERVAVVANRTGPGAGPLHLGHIPLLGAIPEDETLRQFDREGRPLWELPADNAAVGAAREVVSGLRVVTPAGAAPLDAGQPA
jgi:CO dehydrogenase maturation factor